MPKLRIGVLAPEFPPMLGGMAELARGLVQALNNSDHVRLYTYPHHGLKAPLFEQHRDLSGRPWVDAETLRSAEPKVDLWLALNAGLVPLASQLQRPFFTYFHGNDFLNPWLPCGPRWLELVKRPYVASLRHGLRRKAIRDNLPITRKVFTNSHQTANLIHHRLAMPKQRIAVVHPGVGDAFFQEPDERPDGESVLRLLTVSRLTRFTARKNVDGVIRAISLLAPSLPLHYNVVGDGDDRPRLEALATQLGVEDRVHFVGAVDEQQLLAAYRQADLFIMASRASKKDVEGFGIVYIEASASGVPVICSREGGATDAVEDGCNGLLIERSSAEHIAAGIEKFAEQRARFPADKVRAFAEQFRWPRISERLRSQLVESLDTN